MSAIVIGTKSTPNLWTKLKRLVFISLVGIFQVMVGSS